MHVVFSEMFWFKVIVFICSNCIFTDIAYIPKVGSMVTVRTLRDLYLDIPGIFIHGDQTSSCSTRPVEIPFTTIIQYESRTTPATYMVCLKCNEIWEVTNVCLYPHILVFCVHFFI